MDAVFGTIAETSARHMTMEAIARRANVGRPTLYKWWPSKAALLMAMFHERLAEKPGKPSSTTVEAALVSKMQRLITSLNGLFGKVMTDLIAEAQSDPKLLEDCTITFGCVECSPLRRSNKVRRLVNSNAT